MGLSDDKFITEEERKAERQRKFDEIVSSFPGDTMKIALRKFKNKYTMDPGLNPDVDLQTYEPGTIVQITYSRKENIFLFRTLADSNSDIWHKMPTGDFEDIDW